MTYWQDLGSLLIGTMGIFAATDRGSLAAAAVVAIFLAGLCWWGCSTYSRLWNTHYRVKLVHHLLCGVAALLTLVGTLLFPALKHAREAATVSVRVWEEQVQLDPVWSTETFKTAYDRVRSLGIEDFRNFPPPPAGGSIPASHEKSQVVCAETYAKSAAVHFNQSRPFLSSIIKAKSEVPREVLLRDIQEYFAKVGNSYPAVKGISLVAREVRSQLELYLPRVVRVFRLTLVGMFFFFQLLPFGLVGLAAYHDLKARA